MSGGRRKPRKAIPHKRVAGYDSTFEFDLHDTILKDWLYHKDEEGKVISVPYFMEHNYFPDFRKEINGVIYYIEAKGRFWTSAEAAKYVAVSKALADNERVIFLFAKPDLPIPGAKKRKNGTRRSHREWAESYGFEWYTQGNFPKRLK